MKVFISWSGERSKQLALALRDWLPLVLHYADPWVSNSDIEAGERWANEVGKELEASNFGIICVTAENVGSPWILFEAGALSKSMQEGRVVPLLLDLDFKDVVGPLAQFQSKKVEEIGLSDLVTAINRIAQSPVPEARLAALFSRLFGDLRVSVEAIPKSTAVAKSRPQHEVLEELVTSVRNLDGRLRDVADDSIARRRRYGRLRPEMLLEAMNAIGNGPRDPTRFLVIGSLFREELPWLYELAMETYRSHKAGSKREAIEAEKRFVRALDEALHGPAVELIGSKDAAYAIREARSILSHMSHMSGLPEPDEPPPPTS